MKSWYCLNALQFDMNSSCEREELTSYRAADEVSVRWLWGWAVLKNGWLLNPRSLGGVSEHWGIWVSPLKKKKKKKKQDRCGVRLKWCTEPEGLMEHIELWFSGLSRFYKEWWTVVAGGFFASWMLIFSLLFLLVDNDAKAQRAALLCLCVWMFLLRTIWSVFVYPCTTQPQNINLYGDNLYGRSLHFSYLWRGEEEEGCGVMCFARLPAASGRELYTKQPPV